jgi:hypothetical protein
MYTCLYLCACVFVIYKYTQTQVHRFICWENDIQLYYNGTYHEFQSRLISPALIHWVKFIIIPVMDVTWLIQPFLKKK